MVSLNPFHLAIQVRCLQEARAFYRDTLGFDEGRSDRTWVDFNMFGHQFVCHHNPDIGISGKVTHIANQVETNAVPVPHFGVILENDQWRRFAERLQHQHVEIIIKPHIRFRGQAGEQATLFFLDPSGNALEFKSFRDVHSIFESHSCPVKD